MPTNTTDAPSTEKTVEDRVLDALTTTPQTVLELAKVTGLGRSTVSKQLIISERDKKAVRTPGGRATGRVMPDRWTKPTSDRLRPGQLKTMVHNYVDNASEPVGAVAISRALGRSSGAVANCLATLASEREIKLVDDKPRRYWHKRG